MNWEKAICFLGISLLSSFIPCFGQAQLGINWDLGLGGLVWEECNSVRKTPDGGFILGGLTSSPISGDVSEPNRGIFDYWIVKLDSLGQIEWEKRYGGNKGDRLWVAEPTYDGGYILGGHSASDATGDKSGENRGGEDFWVIKTDSIGNIEWERTYGGDTTDILFSLIPLPDGGYIMGGNSRSGPGGDKTAPNFGGLDWWIIRTDSEGEVLWEKTIGGNDNDRLNQISIADDGGFYLGGGARSDISGNITLPLVGVRDFFFVKIDESGEILWQRRYGGTNEDEINSFRKTLDGGFILGGGTRSDVGGDKNSALRGIVDFWVIKTDPNGQIQWERTFGTPGLENLYSLEQNSVGYYILGGFSPSNAMDDKSEDGRGGYDFWLVYVDPEGNKLWDKTFGGPDNDVLTSLIQNEDGTYILAGHSSSGPGGDKISENQGFNDSWIIRTGCDVKLDIGMDTLVCSGSSIEVNPIVENCEGCKYRWSDGGNEAKKVVNPFKTVSYQLLVYDSIGCFAIDSLAAVIQPPPVIEFSNDTVACSDPGISLYAGKLGRSFLWSTGDTTASLIPDSSGEYHVLVTDSLGCTNFKSIQVELHEPLYMVDTVFECSPLNDFYRVHFEVEGGNMNNYSVIGDAGDWSGLSFTSDWMPVNQSYSFVVDDGGACEPLYLEGTYTCPCLTNAGEMVLDELKICGLDSAKAIHLGGITLDSNDLFQYILHDGSLSQVGQIFASQPDPVFTFQPGLEYGQQYIISAVAGYGDSSGLVNVNDVCLSVTPGAVVHFFQQPTAQISASDTIIDCETPNITLDGSQSTPASISFEWKNENGSILSENTIFEISEGGTYFLKTTGNLGSCADSTSITIVEDIEYPDAYISSPSVLTCQDSLALLDATSSTMDTCLSYEWTGPGIVDFLSDLEVVVDEAGVYELLVFNEKNGCFDSFNVTVEEDKLELDVKLDVNGEIDCHTPDVQLSANINPGGVPFSFEWLVQSGSPENNPYTLNPVVEDGGNYYLEVINLNNGCVSGAGIEVIEWDGGPTSASLTVQPPSCYEKKDGSVFLENVTGGTEPFLFALNDNALFQPDAYFNGLGAGNYLITVEDVQGCRWDTLVYLEQPTDLQMDLGEDREVFPGDSISIQALVNIPWEEVERLNWSVEGAEECPGDECSILGIKIKENTFIRAEVLSTAGCRTVDEVFIRVVENKEIFIPNAFSPNGDGNNDFFRLFGDEQLDKINVLRVFSRWGELVFEVEDIDPDAPASWWDGRFRNKLLPTGAYVYFADLSLRNGNTVQFKGDVNLIR